MSWLLTLSLVLGAAPLLQADRDVSAASIAESATELKVMAKGHVSAHGQHQKSHQQGRPHQHEQANGLEEDRADEQNDKVQRIMDAMEGHGSLPRPRLQHYSPELADQIEGHHPHRNQEQQLAAPGQHDTPARRLQRQSREEAEETNDEDQPHFEKHSPGRHRNDFAETDIRQSSGFAQTDARRSSEKPRHLAHARQSPPEQPSPDVPERKSSELTQERPVENTNLAEDHEKRVDNVHDAWTDAEEGPTDDFEPREKQQKPAFQTEATSHSREQREEQSVPPRFGDIDINGDGFIDGIEYQNAIAKGVLK